MNRRQFMRELGSGLVKTLREVAAPLMERDMEKLERLGDDWSGYRFVPLALPPSFKGPVMDLWEGAEPLLLRKSGQECSVYSGKCPGCGNLLHYLYYADKAACFSCGSQYGWAETDRSLRKLPMRGGESGWTVGIPGKEKAHA